MGRYEHSKTLRPLAYFILAAITFVLLAVGAIGGNRAAYAAPPPDLERTPLITGLSEPTAFRHLPDGRILIAEKAGAIKLSADGQPLTTVVTIPTDHREERGLLGIEPDPDFATNGWLYVAYTTAANYDRLSRFTMTGGGSIALGSEIVLLESTQSADIFHHGGEVRFGPDGKLYWAMGMNTFSPNSQDLTNIHGKVLRLNKDGSIPPDNPFVNTPNAVDQIWAYGLRNPFRFTFTPNGKLFAGDVGGDSWEELNFVQSGGNYGWPAAEGNCTACPYINPTYAYPHTPPPAKAGSISATMVYAGSNLPAQYQDKFFIGDYTLGWVKYLTFDADYSTFISEHMFDPEAGTIVQISQGPDQNIYQLNIYPGVLYKIAPSGGNRTPTAVATANPVAGLAPLDVTFSSAGSNDPDGTPLTYSWDFGDGTTSTEANPTKTYTINGTYNVVLTVSDGDKSATATVKVTVGNRLPTATITAPTNGANYNAGDTIAFTATGTDPEDGDLPDSAFTWKVEFHHADHIHPFRDSITGKTGMVELATSPDNSSTTWYRFIVTVTDSAGLTDTKSVDIYPNLVDITWTTNYPDAKFTIDGIPYIGSRTERAVVGVRRVLDAPSPQYVATTQYVFSSWSDGQPQNHTITTPATNTAYTANFSQFQQPPAPWRSQDVGPTVATGYDSYDNGTYTVRGAGGDIWGTIDEFHYLHQPLNGDGEIIARVTSQDRTSDWAKSGIMIKESATPGAKYALLAVTPDNGINFQYNFDGQGASTPYTFPNAWLKLKRAGNVFTAYTSADGATWTQLGAPVTIDMASSVTIGLFVCSHQYGVLNTSQFDNVSVNTGWSNQDIGEPGVAGSATQAADGTYTVKGSGNDIWAANDQFHYVYQPLVGDGELSARVTSQTNTEGWAKAGVMIKQSTTAGSPYALVGVTPDNGVNFQHSYNSNTGGGPYAFPNAWLKIKRVGSIITGYTSSDGVTWTEVGTANITMTPDATIGLFVTSHNNTALSTATFDNIQLVTTPPQSTQPPAPWEVRDVGSPAVAGSSNYTNGVFTLNGAGEDIWALTDQFHFVHQTLPASGEIVARVTSQGTETGGWAKSGIMIKQSTAAGSPYALLAVTPDNGINLQHDFYNNTAGGAYTFPVWLKLTRNGNIVQAYRSTDGATWTEVGTVTTTLGSGSVQAGLFVSSHNGAQLNTSTFDNVSVTPY
ncbi:MAG: PQQ-dependent sugar dehydrogenase [Candidatus Saccharimonadales bacterium]